MNSMQLDLKKVIEKLPTTMKANINPTRKSRRVNDSARDYPRLGDVQRFEKFPSVVNQEFISLYREGLDEFLVPYIQQGEMTVTKANRFIEGLIEQIFGNENHYGIFSYLKERNYEGSPERELVRTAERLVNSGWRVMKDGKTNRYKIINSDKETVIDATGRSEFFDESMAMVMDESAAHLFIDGENASKIESLARAVSMNADDLAELGSLDSLLFHTEDRMLTGQIANYKKLRNVLAKRASYPVLRTELSLNDLHTNGFTLSSKKLFSDHDFIMKQGTEEFVVRGISPELNQQFGFNKDMLSVISARINNNLLSNMGGVVTQDVQEISDLGRVVALIHDYSSDDRFLMSRFDVIDSLLRIESFVASGEVSKSFYKKFFSNFAVAVITEVILLGNKWVSLASLGFDSVSGKVYLYNSADAFTTSLEEFSMFYDSYNPASVSAERSFKPFLKDIYPFGLSSETLSILIEALPKEFFTALASLDTSVEGYPFQFTQVSEYLSKAKDFLMSRAK